MPYSASSEYISLIKVVNPDDIGVEILLNKEIKPFKFKDLIISALAPSVDSTALLQRKSILESFYAKLLDPSLEPLGGTEETKDNAGDSDNGEAKKDNEKNGPSDPKKKDKEVVKFFVKPDFIPILTKAVVEALHGMTLHDEECLESCINQLIAKVAFNLLLGRNPTKL